MSELAAETVDTAAAEVEAQADASVVDAVDEAAPPAEELTPEQAEEAAKAAAEKDAADKAAAAKGQALARAKAAAEKEKARRSAQLALKAQAENTQRELAQQRQAAARYQADLEAQKAEAAKYRAEYEAMKADPMAAFEKLGVTADKVAQEALRAGTPEALAERKERAILERIEAAERRAEAFEKAEQERQAKAAEAAQRASWQQAEENFVKGTLDATAYPFLSRMAEKRPQALVREALQLHRDITAETGRHASDDDVRAYLESQYADIYSQTNPNGSAKSAAGQTASEKTPGSSTPDKNVAGKPRTLTNDMAERGSLPPNFDDLDDQAQFRYLAKLVDESQKSRG